MKIYKTKKTDQDLCECCVHNFATCPKATHIVFGNGVGNDNVIECSGFINAIKYLPEYIQEKVRGVKMKDRWMSGYLTGMISAILFGLLGFVIAKIIAF